jgi:hypothetical protein
MDDLLIFSKTIEELAERLQQVLDRLRRANFTLNLAKFHFAMEVEYLGHIEIVDLPPHLTRPKPSKIFRHREQFEN